MMGRAGIPTAFVISSSETADVGVKEAIAIA